MPLQGDTATPAERLPATASDGAEDERRAIDAVLGGDPAAFRVVVRGYQQRVFGLAWMMTRDRSTAEEVTQDAFLNAFRHLDRYDRSRPLHPWLASITVRLAQTWLRRQGSRPRLAGPQDEPAAHDLEDRSVARPEEVLIADEQQRALWSQVAALSSGERAAVLLHYQQQCSVEEVARQLGVVSGTVKTLLFRARKKLRERLKPHPEPAIRQVTPRTKTPRKDGP